MTENILPDTAEDVFKYLWGRTGANSAMLGVALFLYRHFKNESQAKRNSASVVIKDLTRTMTVELVELASRDMGD